MRVVVPLATCNALTALVVLNTLCIDTMMIQSFFSIVAVVIFGACLSDISYALIVNITPARYYNCNTRYQTILYTIPNDNDAEEEITSDDNSIDIDQQKIALEGVLKNSFGESNTDTTIKNTSNILTSSRKMRLEREIELIKQLDPEHLDNKGILGQSKSRACNTRALATLVR